MSLWNPWRGCKRVSEGCLHCYIHKGDVRRGVDTSVVRKTDAFYRPIEKKKNGEYKMKGGQLVYVCFQSDFLIEEADPWRQECWEMIRERQDLHFLFLTKRIDRFSQCVPSDWGDGYSNVTVCCTIENQIRATERLQRFKDLKIPHKQIVCQPLLEQITIEPYLDEIECVVVGGESDLDARVLDYGWVLDIRQQCINQNVEFQFRQCGTNFLMNGTMYRLQTKNLISQARKASIDWKPGC